MNFSIQSKNDFKFSRHFGFLWFCLIYKLKNLLSMTLMHVRRSLLCNLNAFLLLLAHIHKYSHFYWTHALWRVLQNHPWPSICLSGWLSISLAFLSGIAYWFFLIFGSVAFFSRKTHFCPNLSKNVPDLGFFRKILSLVFFFINSLKWKLILLLIFKHQFHICQNACSSVMSQNAVSQSNWKIL